MGKVIAYFAKKLLSQEDKEWLDKRKPKELEQLYFDNQGKISCPACGNNSVHLRHSFYCPNCGQRIYGFEYEDIDDAKEVLAALNRMKDAYASSTCEERIGINNAISDVAHSILQGTDRWYSNHKYKLVQIFNPRSSRSREHIYDTLLCSYEIVANISYIPLPGKEDFYGCIEYVFKDCWPNPWAR